MKTEGINKAPMKKLLFQIVKYILYFKALFWTFLALMQFLFPITGTMLPIYTFLFLLNGIVFFTIGFAFQHSPREVFRGAVVFLIGNIALVLLDGFGMMDALSIIIDIGVIGVLIWNQGLFNLKKLLLSEEQIAEESNKEDA